MPDYKRRKDEVSYRKHATKISGEKESGIHANSTQGWILSVGEKSRACACQVLSFPHKTRASPCITPIIHLPIHFKSDL